MISLLVCGLLYTLFLSVGSIPIDTEPNLSEIERTIFSGKSESGGISGPSRIHWKAEKRVFVRMANNTTSSRQEVTEFATEDATGATATTRSEDTATTAVSIESTNETQGTRATASPTAEIQQDTTWDSLRVPYDDYNYPILH